MSGRQPRIKIMCCICEKIFTENKAQAKKRLYRENMDQCCSKDCLTEYRARKKIVEKAMIYNQHSLSRITAGTLEPGHVCEVQGQPEIPKGQPA